MRFPGIFIFVHAVLGAIDFARSPSDLVRRIDFPFEFS